MSTSDEIKIKHPGYKKWSSKWAKVRDAIEGEDKIKEGGPLYLPVPSAQTSTDSKYLSYLARASFYGVSDRTLSGLIGLVFRVESMIDVPTAMEYLQKTSTPNGLSLETLIRIIFRDSLSVGRVGLLVDAKASETNSIQPFIAKYLAEDIWNWDVEFDEGIEVLTRVVLREAPSKVGLPTVLRELILDGQYTQILWQEKHGTEGKENDFEVVEEIVPKMQGKGLTYIPFEFVGGPGVRKPPFLDLVNVNIAHYRNSADYEQSLYFTAQPTPYFLGVSEDQVPKEIGSGTIWTSLRPEAKVGMLEFQGAGINSLKEAMREKEVRMAVLGARIIRDDSEKSNITAETTRLNSRSDNSVLFEVTDHVESSFNKVLKDFVGPWVDSEPDDIDVSLNRDHVETQIGGADLTAYIAGWQAGAYSYESLFEILQRGEIIPADVTIEDERDRISKNLPLGLITDKEA